MEQSLILVANYPVLCVRGYGVGQVDMLIGESFSHKNSLRGQSIFFLFLQEFCPLLNSINLIYAIAINWFFMKRSVIFVGRYLQKV